MGKNVEAASIAQNNNRWDRERLARTTRSYLKATRQSESALATDLGISSAQMNRFLNQKTGLGQARRDALQSKIIDFIVFQLDRQRSDDMWDLLFRLKHFPAKNVARILADIVDSPVQVAERYRKAIDARRAQGESHEPKSTLH